MAAIIPVPTLSAAGWVTSKAEKADFLLSHWYESDKSQTALCGNNVSSLAYVLEQNSGDPVSAQAGIRAELERYLLAYYPEGVNVQVKTNAPLTDPTPRVEIKIYVEVIEAGQTYIFGHLLQIANSRLEKVLRLNNDGVAP
jgi:hypothetical protein